MRFVELLTPECQKNVDYLPIPTIHQCLEKVVAGDADLVVIPVENSTNGSVVLALDSLRDLIHNNASAPPSRLGSSDGTDDKTVVAEDPADQDLDTLDGLKTTKITVINEIFVPIQHCLLSFAPSVDSISKVYTHPQAWGQVTKFLDTNIPTSKAPRIDTTSTSAAAARVAHEQDEKNENNEQNLWSAKGSGAEDGGETGDETFSAAIASRAAAKVHNVPILVPDISNLSTNTTRFLVFARQGFPIDKLQYKEGTKSVIPTTEKVAVPAKRTSSETELGSNSDSAKRQAIGANGTSTAVSSKLSSDFVTLVSLTVAHDEPGALCTCLQALSSKGINLTSINSRPAYNPSAENTASNWAYVFFIEFYGNLYTDSVIRQSLRTVKKHSSKLTVLGSFPRNPAYYSSKTSP